MATTITGIVKHRVATAAEYTSENPLLYEGELAFESDTRKTKIGDGTTVWDSLDYTKIDSVAISDVTDLQDELDSIPAAPGRTLYLSDYPGDMQSAIDALSSDGGTLYIDTDTDLTPEAPIELKTNIHIIGVGMPTIACSSAAYAFEGDTALSNVRLENLNFTGVGINPSNGVLRIYNINNQKQNIALRNINIFNNNATAISIVKCDDLILENVWVLETLSNYGIDLEACNRAHLLNCNTENSATYGLRMLTCQQSTVINFESKYDNIGIYLDTNTHNNTFIGSKVRDSTGNAIEEQGDNNTYIECSTADTGGSYSINDQYGTGVIWINCDFDAYIHSYSTSQNPPDSNVVLLSEITQYFNDFGQNILEQLHSGEGIELTNPVDGSSITEPVGPV